MAMSCGIDWSEDHHDVAVVDAAGHLVAKQRITDDAAGFAQLLGLLAEAGDHPQAPIPVAIETARGLLVARLRATGRPVYAINPMAVARYRQRHTVSGKKSDHADAVVLAGILRTDQAAHRPLPADSELVRAIAVLARAQQDAVWDRTQATTSCARCCASTTQGCWPPSAPPAAASCGPRPARCWPLPPPPPTRPG
jgi:Transposase